MNRVLLMCFSNEQSYKTHLQNIREIYRPNAIFVLANRFDDNEIFITFNTEFNFKQGGYIKINKKRETNTIFTIDAVNLLSIEEVGKIDKTFIPNWNEFENCILLSRDGKFNCIPSVVKEIIRL